MEFIFTHANIQVSNMKKSVKFYNEMFGLEPVRYFHDKNLKVKLTHMIDKDKNSTIMLLEVYGDVIKMQLRQSASYMLTFMTENILKSMERHKKLGCTILRSQLTDIGPRFYLMRDPDGHIVEVSPELEILKSIRTAEPLDIETIS